MNEQDEKLIRQSKWSGRRVILLYWFALVFIGTSAAVGFSTTLLTPQYSVSGYDHSGIADPTTGEYEPEDCATCHPAEVDGWNLTKHAWIIGNYTNATGTYVRHNTTQDDYNYTEYINDGGCCHVTNWVNDTSIVPSGDVSVWGLGIECGACHKVPGEPATYFTDPGTGFPFEKTCSGRCHIPGSRGKTWKQTGHSDSFDDLLASTGAFDYCLHCMAGESTYEDISLGNIDCVTCHDPHNEEGVRFEHDLRKNGTLELCGTCHTDVVDFLNDTTFVTPHNITAISDCTDCHGYYITNVTLATTGVLHNWTMVLPDACGQCHGNQNATRIAMMGLIQGDITTLLATYDTKLENTTATLTLAKAVTDVNQTTIGEVEDLLDEAAALAKAVTGEPSTGFHNPDLAEDKVQLAIVKLDEAYDLAEDLIPEPTDDSSSTLPTSTTGGRAPAIGILATIGILGLAVFLRKKKR